MKICELIICASEYYVFILFLLSGLIQFSGTLYETAACFQFYMVF